MKDLCGMNIITEHFFKQYYRQLCHYAWQYLGDLEASKDVVNDVFTKMIHQQPVVACNNNDKHLKNYLYQAVRNASLNQLRKKKSEQKYLEATPFEEASEESIELNIIQNEVMQAVYEVIEELPISCREVFKKAYIEGLSNAEVAAELELSINTIKTQKQRGLKFLKSRLSPDLIIWLALFIKI